MKVGKPKSKRVPVRLRHKIEKASAAKQRKQRKEAKKNPEWRSRLKKDPGIPNLFPYKDKILAEVEESRRRKEEEAQKRKELAKALRNGTAVEEKQLAGGKEIADHEEGDGDEVFYDAGDVEDLDEDEEMDDDDSNPMAALLASAQARAQAYTKEDEESEDEEDEADDTNKLSSGPKSQSKDAKPAHKALPKQALADPIKAVSALLERLQATQDGIQQLLDYYQIPPLVTAGSDITSRFLVDVARKRGRIGRGGIPNLHSAALVVLGDIHDERLRLPALEVKPTSAGPSVKSDVQIVAKMAEPFRIEGLF